MAKKSKKRTLVAIVLDSSGSMSSMKEQAIGLFNTQRDEIVKGSKKAGETLLSLVVFGETPAPPTLANPNLANVNFGGGVRAIHENVKPADVPRLDEKTYQPQAMTPMRDGIGRAIGIVEREDDGGADTACLVVVVTDGQENASTEWSAEALSKKVADLQGTGRWTFAIYGCDDLDLAELKATAGLGAIPTANVGSYMRGAQGMATASLSMASNTSSYFASRAAGETASKAFATDEEDSTK
jgi:uncharacterized protein YegL